MKFIANLAKSLCPDNDITPFQGYAGNDICFYRAAPGAVISLHFQGSLPRKLL
ncbi:MAG TPA: hypothetical protein VK645_07150 [Chitinophagaceae bacterium]|nr:hypothetical protein [Chitinophagaceae bacterium]